MGTIGNGSGEGSRQKLSALAGALSPELSARLRMPLVTAVYTVGLIASLWLAYGLRFDFTIPAADYRQLWQVSLWLVPFQLSLLLLIGQFSGLLSYFSIPDLRRLFLGLVTASLLVAILWIVADGRWSPPRSVILSDCLLSFLILASIRLVFRRAREMYFHAPARPGMRVARIGIVGAGDAGAALARELLLKGRLGMNPVVFFDDDPMKWKRSVHDVAVVGAPERLLAPERQWKLDKVIIAMPSATGKRIREIVAILQKAGLRFQTIPSLDQLATGRLKLTQLRPVEIEDLLGRVPVQVETENIRKVLEGRVVMVTGAGGSIGSELCRQIASYHPHQLLLVERSEVQLFPIEQQLSRMGYGDVSVPVIADILDEPRMRSIFQRYEPEVVFHAAAHKHVPLMERHPDEAIKNNTLGTARIAKLVLEQGVDRFVMISTDKAINPTSVMGVTKRLAEIFVQSLWASQSTKVLPLGRSQTTDLAVVPRHVHRSPGRTKFMAVRFGNVLGSSGSVIPTFKEQIEAGGPVTVTHPEVTRFFMTIPEAAGLVLQSAAQGHGGEIFVLDMGKPVKIVNLARQVIELSGLKPDEDIEIKFVGLRPGEKLYEELSHAQENVLPTQHPKIMRFVSRPLPLAAVQEFLERLTEQLHQAKPSELKKMLKQFVPEYQPYLEPALLGVHNGNGHGNGNGNSNGNGHGNGNGNGNGDGNGNGNGHGNGNGEKNGSQLGDSEEIVLDDYSLRAQ